MILTQKEETLQFWPKEREEQSYFYPKRGGAFNFSPKKGREHPNTFTYKEQERYSKAKFSDVSLQFILISSFSSLFPPFIFSFSYLFVSSSHFLSSPPPVLLRSSSTVTTWTRSTSSSSPSVCRRSSAERCRRTTWASGPERCWARTTATRRSTRWRTTPSTSGRAVEEEEETRTWWRGEGTQTLDHFQLLPQFQLNLSRFLRSLAVEAILNFKR